MKPTRLIITAIIAFASVASAQVPGIINYQGRVAVGGTNFNGTGQFKFALVNSTGSTNYWANDGTTIGQPAAAVSNNVAKGLYSILLGDTTITNMTVSIAPKVFKNSDVRLRVWFNDGVAGFQQLTPDQRLGSAGYALVATSVDPASDVTGQRLNIGVGNVIGGTLSTIAGGSNNTASADYTVVGGGLQNTASAIYATVGGGALNIASGQLATVGGGGINRALANYATVGGGQTNTANSAFATVGGGYSNGATGQYATVSGGYQNTASGYIATVGAGYVNAARGDYSIVGGGANNTASGLEGTIGGGYQNIAGVLAFVGGGTENIASGTNATVSGGATNTASGSYSVVGGGLTNAASVFAATVGGGEDNAASGIGAVVGGGEFNIASGDGATVAGGADNVVSGVGGAVGGGSLNFATNQFAMIPGGLANVAGGLESFAAGTAAQAIHDGTFVWADFSADLTPFVSTAINQFLIRASGGVGINTAAPGQPLQIGDTNLFGSVGMIRLVSRTADILSGAVRVWDIGVPNGGADATATNYSFVIKDASTNHPTEFMIQYITGNVGIGRVPAANKLEVEGNASKTTATAWLANSDRRIKTGIQPLTDALATIDRVRPVRFHYTEDYRRAHPSIVDVEYYNVIAQEFRDVFPNSVRGSGEKLPNGEEILQVDTYPATITALAAIQELHQQGQEKDARIAELEHRLAVLETTIQKMSGEAEEKP